MFCICRQLNKQTSKPKKEPFFFSKKKEKKIGGKTFFSSDGAIYRPSRRSVSGASFSCSRLRSASSFCRGSKLLSKFSTRAFLMSNMAEHINKEQKKKGEEKQETENKKEEETYESLKRKGFNVPKPSFCEMERAGTIKGGHHPKGFVGDVREEHKHLKDLIDQLGSDKGAKRREQKALKGECKYCFRCVMDKKHLETLRMEQRMIYQAGKLWKPRRTYKMGKDEDPGMDEDPICDVASLFDISIDSEGFKEMDMDVIGDLRYADDEFKDPDDNLSGPLQRLTTQALALSGASRASWLGSGAPAAGQAVDGGGEAKNFLSSGGLMKTSGENAGIREAGTTLPILSENDEQTSGTPSPSQGETLPESAAQN